MEKVFESERIYFVKVSETLIEDYLKMINDINVRKFISHKEFSQVSYENEMKWVKRKLDEDAKCFSMIEKDTNRFIGNIEIMNIKDNSGELGIAITSDMQNKHYGTEAIKAIIDYGYKELDLKEIYLNVYDTNERAKKCYQNVGFKISGKGTEEADIRMTLKR